MSTAIVWFRRDLRTEHNPALAAALAAYEQVLPVYIHDPAADGDWSSGAASNWWLHHALVDLTQQLDQRLVLLQGPALAGLRQLVKQSGADAVFWNRLYDPSAIERDTGIKQALREDGVRVESHNAGLMFEPWTVANRQGLPFRVFTPFWKHLSALGLPTRLPANVSTAGRLADGAVSGQLPIEAFGLLPSIPWDQGIAEAWVPTRAGALGRLDEFLATDLAHYETGRDRPAREQVSRLSPYLHFGQLSPVEVAVATPQSSPGAQAFLRELGWREFAAYQLYHFPHTADAPLDQRFERFPWRDAPEDLAAWQQGRTGIPMVDAGMRQLWASGWMHNRVRMIVASFLVKNLLLPWQDGARWFWDTLVDADLASNSLGWQWTAGSGADAAPYFRVFNPVLQGQKFDAKGEYVRRWVPELAGLPDKWIHRPWEAPAGLLTEAGVRLGHDYPAPLVDLKLSRQRALQAWDQLKAGPKG
ncbi:MAG: deoxyribodipyrimidine photo-lyase [Chromatiaceae bacterium]|jgi:deoxyribodipyrimidine photo-lyase